MEFKLVSEASFEFGHIANLVNQVSDELNAFFKDKYFGSDIESIYVSVISTSPEFDFIMKVKKPKYSRGKTQLIDHGVAVDVTNSLRFDIKLDYETLLKIKEVDQLKPKIYKHLKDNLPLFEVLKIKNFDREKFSKQLAIFFE